MRKMSQPGKILLGMVLGSLLGVILSFVPAGTFRDAVLLNGVLRVCGEIFLNAFRLIVGPVVFVSLITGVMSMNNPTVLGRIGVKTLLMYLVTTVAAVITGLALAWVIAPGSGLDPEKVSAAVQTVEQASGNKSIADTIIDIVPRNFFRSFTDEIMLQIIFVAILSGLALALLGEKTAILKKIMTELNLFNIKIIDLIMLFAPIGVFSLMARTFGQFGVEAILPLLKYILCVGFAMILLVVLGYAPLLKFYAKLSPLRFFRRYYPVMVLGFSTSSSNAALPLNIETMVRRIGIPERLATLVLSLGATINMNGTAIMQGCAVLFVAQLYGVALSVPQLVGVVATAIIASVGTAGVPGAGIIMLAMVLQSAGLPLEGIAILMGVDRLIDMMRTTINITGDSICACIISKSENNLDYAVFESND